jgi:hypothetical protein
MISGLNPWENLQAKYANLEARMHSEQLQVEEVP